MAWTVPSLDEARALWPDAPDVDADLAAVIEAAYGQCEAFAPAAPDLPTDADLARFLFAVVYQARALWRSGTVGGGDQFGEGGMTVTVFPMDWSVKALLRPSRKPVIG